MYTKVILSCILICTLAFSHVTVAQKGYININAGVMFDQGHTPLAFSADYFISDGISVGIQGYRSQESTSTSSVIGGSTLSMSSRYVSTFVGLRANLHVSSLLPEAYQRFDPYVGVSVGKIVLNGEVNVNLGAFGGQYSEQDNRTYNGITIYVPIGVRYLITKNIGAFAEYNAGVTNTTADIDQNGKLDKFYEKRQYQLGIGLSIRF